MVFVHAKIGELKVKDLSQKLQGISGFIFHLQLCEGHQLKHQILLKSNTEWAIIHRRRVEAIVPQTHKALTGVFVSNQERKATMDYSHVSLWSIWRHRASQRECGSVNCFVFFHILSHQKPFNLSFIIFCLEYVDISQVQCIKSYKAQEHDELTLEKADILHAKTITSDGERRFWWEAYSLWHLLMKKIWVVLSLRVVVFPPGWVEGIRLSDGERGWFPKTYIEEITSRSARLRNLRENIRIKCVTQKLKGAHWMSRHCFHHCFSGGLTF